MLRTWPDFISDADRPPDATPVGLPSPATETEALDDPGADERGFGGVEGIVRHLPQRVGDERSIRRKTDGKDR